MTEQSGMSSESLQRRIKKTCPWYPIVPKTEAENLAFREEVLVKGASDKVAASHFIKMCKEDILFFANAFAWTFDPRRDIPEIPFNTYPFQDEVLLDLRDAMGKEDVVIEKSRDMGATWMFLLIFFWRWMFYRRQTFLIASRTADLVDRTGDTDTLFWKLDYLYEKLPSWMRPNIRRNMFHFENMTNKSVIDGASTTGDIGRGGRRTAVALDEFAAFSEGDEVLAATQAVTNCRLFNSTPKGIANAHYRMVESGIRKVRMHWSEHPLKRQGLYISENGVLKILDKVYWLERANHAVGLDHRKYSLDDFDHLQAEGFNYTFNLDGKLRSPWYDRECTRMPIPALIAQELDIDYAGSGDPVFDLNTVRLAITKYSSNPSYRGELDYDATVYSPRGIREASHGRLLLWQDSIREAPPNDRYYVIGADISFGTGSSDSALVVYDAKTRGKVAEFVHNETPPGALAEYCYALGHWFKGPYDTPALAIWEANGPGRTFGQRMIELFYGNMFYKVNEQSEKKRRSDIPGWFSTKDSKSDLMLRYGTAACSGAVKNRSERAMMQLAKYVYSDKGGIEYQGGDLMSASDSKDGHGDIAIADMVAFRGLAYYSSDEEEVKSAPSAREGTFLWRRNLHLAKKKQMGKDQQWTRGRRWA